MEQLPEVGKNIYIACKKCDRERYFKVITHLTSTSAKCECEVCKTKKTYKLAVPKAPRVTKAGKAKAASKAKVNSDWQKLVGDKTENKKIPYRINTKFEVDQVLDHPMFGVGVVTKSMPAKIEVIFEQEIKTLIHAQVD